MKYWKFIHFKALPYKEYTNALVNSNFTLDYSHPKQTGITIRCFEALSCQTKIITNNIFVKKNKYFNNNNTIVFDLLNKDLFLSEYNSIKQNTISKYRRNIDDFMNELIK